MYKTPKKLTFRRSDLSRGGWFAEETRFYRLWFELLKLSPSYELAKRYRASKGKLSTSDHTRLPEDFERVLAVYDDFGDLQTQHFRPWWLKTGIRLFGSPGAMPKTQLLFKAGKGDGLTEEKLEAVSGYFKGFWLEANQPDVMLIAVPLNFTRQRAMREVKKLYDQNIGKKFEPGEAKYTLATKHTHFQSIVDAMSVLFMRAARPDFKLWQVGVEAKISESYSKMFNSKTSKRSSMNSEDMRSLEILTSRKLKLAKYLVENAARGLFPNQNKPAHMVDFEAKEFHKIISERNKWTQSQYAKYR